jgi:hypothetical protein
LAAVVLDAVAPVGVCSWDVQGGYALHFSKVVNGGGRQFAKVRVQ